MSDRADIIARVRALRARAGDEASSEAEADAAARIAAKIIAEHQLTEAELRERGTSGIAEGKHNDGRARQHPALEMAATGIGALTECTALVRRGENIWIGQPEDVAFAIFLCELIEGAAERAYRTHWRRKFHRAPSVFYRQSFMVGFGGGIRNRLQVIAAERDRDRAAAMTAGTDLMVVKGAIIADYLALTRPMLRNQRVGKRKEPNMAALVGGLQASRDLTLSRPLEGRAGATLTSPSQGEAP